MSWGWYGLIVYAALYAPCRGEARLGPDFELLGPLGTTNNGKLSGEVAETRLVTLAQRDSVRRNERDRQKHLVQKALKVIEAKLEDNVDKILFDQQIPHEENGSDYDLEPLTLQSSVGTFKEALLREEIQEIKKETVTRRGGPTHPGPANKSRGTTTNRKKPVTSSNPSSQTKATTKNMTHLPVNFGGTATKEAFQGWLSVWRSHYRAGLWKAELPDPWESLLPAAMRGIGAKVVISSGGVAGGVVTEGMGYGLLIEGALAIHGDREALENGLGLTKSWLAMVNGPGITLQPLAGGCNKTGSSTKLTEWPYGISVVEWSHLRLGPAGLAAWKFPLNESTVVENTGSASDADQDAILGMVFLAQALGFPEDFVDMVIRTIISFASADLGFPDLYRTLPDGRIMFVPKLGSKWGGLLPPKGKFKTNNQPWCYSPGYFAPANYRAFRDFLLAHWNPRFQEYLPSKMDGTASTLADVVAAFDSAVVAGYNILRHSSCSSGVVANWVGVKAPCADEDVLNCAGVPWSYTPHVGKDRGKCNESGTEFGAFGADASRAVWRIAMDYVLYRRESGIVTIYDRRGHLEKGLNFQAADYLNRIVAQYREKSKCDGGNRSSCKGNATRFAYAFDPKFNETNGTCGNVPFSPTSWWAGFMAYPTFTAFVAPFDGISSDEMSNWLDSFSSICNFSKVNFSDFKSGKKPKGSICKTSYFESSQAVISTLITSGLLSPLATSGSSSWQPGVDMILKDDSEIQVRTQSLELGFWDFLKVYGVLVFLIVAAVFVTRRRLSTYKQLPSADESFLPRGVYHE